MRKMKTVYKILISVLVVLVLFAGIGGYLVFRPAEVQQERIAYFRLSEAGDSSERLFEHMKKGFADLKNSNTLRQQFLSDYESLPSEELSEYVEVAFLFKVKNKSPFAAMNDAQIVFEDMESEVNPYLFTKIVPETINIQPGSEDTLVLSAYLYVKDMNDQEIEQVLKGMTVEISSDVAGIWNTGRTVEIVDDILCEHDYYLE